MNIKKINRKWLTTVAAVTSSVFFFAACEPQDDRPAERPADPDAPTYGEPDREPAPATEEPVEDPGMNDQEDEWNDNTGTN